MVSCRILECEEEACKEEVDGDGDLEWEDDIM